MNGWHSALTALCAGMILIGALHILTPGGAMEKSVKGVLSTVFLLSVLTACLPAFRGFSTQIGAKREEAKAENQSLMETNAEYVVMEVLKKADIPFSKITVRTDKSDDGSISISKVIIVTDCEPQTVRAALSGIDESQEVVITHE